MKLYLIALLLLTGCGSSEQAAQGLTCADFKGLYTGTIIHSDLDISASCTANDLGCGQTYTFTLPNDKGRSKITVAGTPFCGWGLIPGEYNCALKLSGNTVTINCGYGNYSYAR